MSFELLPGLEALRKSADGCESRLVISARKELQSTEYRSRMQDARVRLGEEFFADTPNSLAKLRLSRGFSQQRLAEAIGTSQPHIARIESGRGDLLFATAGRLADALGVKIDDLQIGQAIHIRELQIPEGVKILHDAESVVVQVKQPAAVVEATPGVIPAEGTAEPEIITAKKKDKVDGEEE